MNVCSFVILLCSSYIHSVVKEYGSWCVVWSFAVCACSWGSWEMWTWIGSPPSSERLWAPSWARGRALWPHRCSQTCSTDSQWVQQYISDVQKFRSSTVCLCWHYLIELVCYLQVLCVNLLDAATQHITSAVRVHQQVKIYRPFPQQEPLIQRNPVLQLREKKRRNWIKS